MSFLDYRHPDYETRRRRSVFASLYRTGEVLDKVHESVRREKGTRMQQGDLHLVRRSQGETIGAYRERAYISRFPRHYGRVVTSFVGSLMQSERKASRQWGNALGSPDEEEALMARYHDNVDGSGTSMPQLMQQVADRLVTSHRQWYLLDAPMGEELARLHRIPEKRVLNWVERDGRPVDVLVRESRDDRSSVEEETDGNQTFIRYQLAGWTRYREEDGDPVVIERQEWDFPFWRTPDQTERRLPISYVDLGLGEPVGYNMAQDAKYLYNLLSDLRWALRRTSFSKLAPEGEPLSQTDYELASEAIAEGENFLTFPAQYIAPDAGIFGEAYEIYRQEVMDFYVTALQSYEDAAQEKTATEIMQEQGAGRFSFLSVLARAMDTFENDLYFLIHQIEEPTSPSTWQEASVERSRDFQPVDAEKKATQLMEAAFPRGAVPIGESGDIDAAKRIADLLGIDYDEAELEEDVRSGRDRAAQAPTDDRFL
jgi:hypothetical protein